MNVQELIDWLQQIENKSLPIGYFEQQGKFFEEIEIVKEIQNRIELI